LEEEERQLEERHRDWFSVRKARHLNRSVAEGRMDARKERLSVESHGTLSEARIESECRRRLEPTSTEHSARVLDCPREVKAEEDEEEKGFR